MLEDDIHGAVYRETGSSVTTGYGVPDVSASRENRATCIGAIIGGLKDLCHMNGINEAQAALMIGRVAMDLCQIQK